jgi:hypothetical protein
MKSSSRIAISPWAHLISNEGPAVSGLNLVTYKIHFNYITYFKNHLFIRPK